MALKSKYVDPQFWVDTADRAVATFAQATVGALTAGQVASSIVDVDLAGAAAVGGLAALVAVLTSVAFRAAPTVPEDAAKHLQH